MTFAKKRLQRFKREKRPQQLLSPSIKGRGKSPFKGVGHFFKHKEELHRSGSRSGKSFFHDEPYLQADKRKRRKVDLVKSEVKHLSPSAPLFPLAATTASRLPRPRHPFPVDSTTPSEPPRTPPPRHLLHLCHLTRHPRRSPPPTPLHSRPLHPAVRDLRPVPPVRHSPSPQAFYPPALQLSRRYGKMLLLLSSVVIFMWAISVCKVMFFSSSPGKSSTFLIGAGQKSERKRNVLLVVAHPDDESMFFSPTLLFFTAAGQTVHVLCLSTGNADGKGDIRKEEIFRACVILKVLPHNVTVLDDPHLQDGFCNIWDPHYVGQIIGEHIEGRNIDLVVTFDNYGISGHPNHRAVHDGACKFLFQNPGRKIEAWELVSISIFRKYSGPLELWSWSLSNIFTGDRRRSCLVNGHPRKSYLAMAEHSSQWVWYRKLFVLFSSYTYINTLRRISA